MLVILLGFYFTVPVSTSIVEVGHLKPYVWGSVQMLEQQRRERKRMKETKHHYFTPLGQCQRALLAN